MDLQTCRRSLIVFESLEEVPINVRLTLLKVEIKEYSFELVDEVLLHMVVLLPLCQIEFPAKGLDVVELLQ